MFEYDLKKETAIDISDKDRSSVRKRLQKLLSSLKGENEQAIDALLAGAMTVCLLPQQFVFRSGSVCGTFLILLKGTVRVQLTSSKGREVTLYRVVPGNSCIVTTSCLLNGDSYPAEAIAESAIEAIAVPQESFHRAFEMSPGFRQYVFSGFSTSLADVIAKTEQLAFVSVDSRLSSALLDLHKKGENRVTHQALAIELGTAREVVSRRLKSFESAGWVRLQRGRVTVSDRIGLQSLGNSSPRD